MRPSTVVSFPLEDIEDMIGVIVENPAGKQFKCRVHKETLVAGLSSRFFQFHKWPETDRAVAELVNPENPGETRRLQGRNTLADAGLRDGDVIRIFPEAVAGAVDQKDRIRALVADHNDMEALASWNDAIRFTANKTFAPTLYTIDFDVAGFVAPPRDGQAPAVGKSHKAEILLTAEYPGAAPNVRWLTKIFHPNIHPKTGDVCLGAIQERYRPSLGLARIVAMLSEMIRCRNYDMTSALNAEAAQWMADPDNWPRVEAIGGMPYQGPIKELLEQLDLGPIGEEEAGVIEFTPL